MLPTLELSTRDTMPLSFEFVPEKLLNPFMSPPLNQPFDSTSAVVNRLRATFFTTTRTSQKAIISKGLLARKSTQSFLIKYAMNMASL
jgi:hypothetical protein